MVYNNGFGVKIISESNQDKLQHGSYNYVTLYNNTEYKLQLTNDRSTDCMAEVYIEGDQIGIWFIPAHNNIIIDRPANIARKFTFFKETDIRAINVGVTPGNTFNGVIKVIFYPKRNYIPIISEAYQPNNPIIQRTQIPISRGLYNSSPVSSPLNVSQDSYNSSPVSSPLNVSQGSYNTQLNALQGSYNSQLNNSQMLPLSPRHINSYQSGSTILGSQSNQTFGFRKRFSDDEIDWSNKTEIVIRLIVKSPSDNREFISIRDISSQPIPPRIEDYLPFIY